MCKTNTLETVTSLRLASLPKDEQPGWICILMPVLTRDQAFGRLKSPPIPDKRYYMIFHEVLILPNLLGQRSIYDNGTCQSEKVLLQETMPSGKNAKNCAIMAKCLKISTHLPPKDYST